MQHNIQQLFDKVSAMRDLAIVAHNMKYARPSEDNFDEITHLVEQIQALAGDIFNDRELHPKVKEKQEEKAWQQQMRNEMYLTETPTTECDV